jgi:F-type H+-transporting ATPase subunit b
MSFLENPYTWTALAIVVLVYFAWTPAKTAILSGLDARAERITKDLDEAAGLRAQAEKLLAEYTAKHQEAMKQADEIVAHAKEEAARLAVKAEADLQASLKRREEMALQRIAQAEAQATAEVRAASVDLAMAATQKLLAQGIDRARQDGLIDGAIKNLAGRLN